MFLVQNPSKLVTAENESKEARTLSKEKHYILNNKQLPPRFDPQFMMSAGIDY